MSKSFSYRGIASFEYDFDIDGGAQGVIATGEHLPGGAVCYGGAAYIYETVESGGAAFISIGTIPETFLFMAFHDFSDFTIVNGIVTDALQPDAMIAPTQFQVEEMAIEITGADLTAGRFIYTLLYFIPSGQLI